MTPARFVFRELGNSIFPVGVSCGEERFLQARHSVQVLLLVGNNTSEAEREVSLFVIVKP